MSPMKTNPGLVAAASQVLVRKTRSYTAVIPPENAQFVFQYQVTPFGLNGDVLLINEYPIEAGFAFRMTGVLWTYVGTAFADALADNTGDTFQTLFTLDVDVPAAIGSTVVFPVQPGGYNAKGLDGVPFHLGALNEGCWKFPGPMLYDPGEVIRIKVLTAAPFPETAGAFISIIEGWTWPQKREEL